MADNVVANAASGGAQFRAFSDGTNEWPAGVIAWVTGGSAGAWTIQEVTGTNGLPVNVLNTSLAITAAALPLPTGAATAAKQPAIGTAGTASADVLTVQGIASMTAIKTDGSGVTQPVSGTVTANAGTGSFTVAQATAANLNATVTGTVTSNIGTTNGLALDATLTGGTQKTIPVAGTTGGATPYHLVSAASNNATSVKASAGTVYDVQCFNTNASPRYLKFYDKATAPAPATDVPVKVIMMPGNASGAGATAAFPVGVNFANGIAIAIVTGIADNDNTAVGASDCVISFDYK